MCKEENNKTNEPMNIQNSREEVDSSFSICGILFHLDKIKTINKNKNVSRKMSRCPINPLVTNECTLVSPSMPLRVKNDAYNTNKKDSEIKMRLAFKAWPVDLATTMV